MVRIRHKPAKLPRRQWKIAQTYRGVRLAMPVAQTRFSLEEIKRVVHEVIAASADAIPGGK